MWVSFLSTSVFSATIVLEKTSLTLSYRVLKSFCSCENSSFYEVPESLLEDQIPDQDVSLGRNLTYHKLVKSGQFNLEKWVRIYDKFFTFIVATLSNNL